uniref:Uncharacterized protein n=1 Tax=Ditylenchus dipsaci TaxID=166011 RepID=A0A915DD19_9BILA
MLMTMPAPKMRFVEEEDMTHTLNRRGDLIFQFPFKHKVSGCHPPQYIRKSQDEQASSSQLVSGKNEFFPTFSPSILLGGSILLLLSLTSISDYIDGCW